MTEGYGFHTATEVDEDGLRLAAKLYTLQEELVTFFKNEGTDGAYERELSEKFNDFNINEKIEVLKSEAFIFSRKLFIYRNFGIERYASMAGFDIQPPKRSTYITLSINSEKLEFSSEISPLELVLESLSDSVRDRFFNKFHPSRNSTIDISMRNETDEKKIKREFIKHQNKNGLKSNPHEQNKIYDDIIKSVLGNKYEKFCRINSLRYYQLIELLDDVRNRFGCSLAPIFNRIINNESFDLIPEQYTSPYSIPLSNEDTHRLLSKNKKENQEERTVRNANLIPALLKELLTYLIDGCKCKQKKNIIRILPELFDRLTAMQSIAPQHLNEIYLSRFKEIGDFINENDDILVEFAFQLQLKLINQKYRSITSLWDRIKNRKTRRLSQNCLEKHFREYRKKTHHLLKDREKGIDFSSKNSRYGQHNKLAIQILTISEICLNYKNFELWGYFHSYPNDPSFYLKIMRAIAYEKEILKYNSTDILENFSAPSTKGTKRNPKNRLNMVERSGSLALSRRKSVENYLYKSHIHYWGLFCFYTTLIHTPGFPKKLKEHEERNKKSIQTVWSCFTSEPMKISEL